MDAKIPDVLIDVFTTDTGTIGAEGLVKVGSRRTIPVAAFSARWMKPATQGDAKKIRAHERATKPVQPPKQDAIPEKLKGDIDGLKKEALSQAERIAELEAQVEKIAVLEDKVEQMAAMIDKIVEEMTQEPVVDVSDAESPPEEAPETEEEPSTQQSS